MSKLVSDSRSSQVKISLMALLQCSLLRTYPVSGFGPLTTWTSYECRMRQLS